MKKSLIPAFVACVLFGCAAWGYDSGEGASGAPGMRPGASVPVQAAAGTEGTPTVDTPAKTTDTGTAAAPPPEKPGKTAPARRHNRTRIATPASTVAPAASPEQPAVAATAPLGAPAPQAAHSPDVAGAAAAAAEAAPQPAEPVAVPAPATPVPPPPAAAATEIPSLAADFPLGRALGGFGIVLSLMGAAVFGTRKFAPQLFRKPVPEKSLKVIETIPMGDKRSISVIQVEDKRFLIGNTTSQITLLAPLRGPLSVEEEPVAQAAPAEPVAPRPKMVVDRFRNIFEIEKASPGRNGARPKTIPPDVRAKMRQLRESLEQ